ncbi:hypothetical protein KC799_15505 [candidate division KSB1 bacterium]|nr:hypothetical protein [candidate division KSB1 bacterium]
MFIGFTAYFLLMHLLGQSDNSTLRLFNGIIHMLLLALAIRQYRLENDIQSGKYLPGVALGMYASAIGIVAFSVFMLLFLTFHPTLMGEIKEQAALGRYLNPFTATLSILAEGLVVSLIGSYVWVRIFEWQAMRKNQLL